LAISVSKKKRLAVVKNISIFAAIAISILCPAYSQNDDGGWNRPQTPVKPYPYTEEEVFYRNETEEIRLAATL